MDIRQLKYIVGIAESGSITRAAEGLYISQSGLNQQLMRNLRLYISLLTFPQKAS